MMVIGGAATLLIICGAIAAALVAVMVFVYVFIPLLRGIGWSIGKFFWFIGACFTHVFQFIGGTFVDTFRAVGALPAMIIFALLAMGSVVIGRWSAASHFGSNVQKEIKTFGGSIYRVAIGHPLRLLGLHSMLEGVEERVPAALAEAPGSDKPSRRVGVFEGYEIVGSLPGGGSGGKLYIAEPRIEKRGQISKTFGECPDRVVIKSFATSEGSSIPQIVRESRALESAKQLGLILDHELDEKRFYYVMPYVPGESLGAMVRGLHTKRGSDGLQENDIRQLLGYIGDVLNTLSVYHRGGLWHKDIKPENIIISEDGRAHVVDLGLVTPLRSAMTLTTHGTEYFRDPEMVRLALNGVKVNEIDGTKFDIYAAGAVLFYMIENTFPSHGGLSTVTKPCPEAMKWIIRRAMTDYSKRYTSAEEMYEDVKAVAIHAQMNGMRPVDLPSLRGGGVASAQASSANDLHAVGEGDEKVGAGVGVGVGHDDSWESMYTGRDVKSETPGPWNREPERKKFKFKVTNWWTGSYEPVGVSVGQGQGQSHFEDMKQQLKDVRKQVRESAHHARASMRASARSSKREMRGGLLHAVHTAKAEMRRNRNEYFGGNGGARVGVAKGSGLSASEQVARAKARAAELRKHARTRMGQRSVRGPGERVSFGMLAAAFIVATLTILFVGAGMFLFTGTRRVSVSSCTMPNGFIDSTVEITPHTPILPTNRDDAQLRSFYGIDWPADVPMSYVVVNDHPQPGNDHVSELARKVNASMDGLGFSPDESEEGEAEIRSRVGQFMSGPYAVGSGENPDPAEDAVSNLLKSSLPDIGCVIWLYPIADKPNDVGYWVITRDSTNSKLDDNMLSYLQKTVK